MEACRVCDGRGKVRRETEDGYQEAPNACSVCFGSGVKPGPSKGGKRRYVHKDEDDDTLEAQTRAFLRKHGF